MQQQQLRSPLVQRWWKRKTTSYSQLNEEDYNFNDDDDKWDSSVPGLIVENPRRHPESFLTLNHLVSTTQPYDDDDDIMTLLDRLDGGGIRQEIIMDNQDDQERQQEEEETILFEKVTLSHSFETAETEDESESEDLTPEDDDDEPEEEQAKPGDHQPTKLRWADQVPGHQQQLEVVHQLAWQMSAQVRIVILLLDWALKKFEFLHCEYETTEASSRLTVQDTLQQLSGMASDPFFAAKQYTALCRYDSELINMLALQDFNLHEGEILVAVPAGCQPKQVVWQANALLTHKPLRRAVRKARLSGRALQKLQSSKEWAAHKRRSSKSRNNKGMPPREEEEEEDINDDNDTCPQQQQQQQQQVPDEMRDDQESFMDHMKELDQDDPDAIPEALSDNNNNNTSTDSSNDDDDDLSFLTVSTVADEDFGTTTYAAAPDKSREMDEDDEDEDDDDDDPPFITVAFIFDDDFSNGHHPSSAEQYFSEQEEWASSKFKSSDDSELDDIEDLINDDHDHLSESQQEVAVLVALDDNDEPASIVPHPVSVDEFIIAHSPSGEDATEKSSEDATDLLVKDPAPVSAPVSNEPAAAVVKPVSVDEFIPPPSKDGSSSSEESTRSPKTAVNDDPHVAVQEDTVAALKEETLNGPPVSVDEFVSQPAEDATSNLRKDDESKPTADIVKEADVIPAVLSEEQTCTNESVSVDDEQISKSPRKESPQDAPCIGNTSNKAQETPDCIETESSDDVVVDIVAISQVNENAEAVLIPATQSMEEKASISSSMSSDTVEDSLKEMDDLSSHWTGILQGLSFESHDSFDDSHHEDERLDEAALSRLPDPSQD